MVRRGGWVVVLLAGLAAPVAAAEIELKNDSWTDGAAVNVQAGFGPGDIGAARFSPPAGTAQITRLQFLFAGDTSMPTVGVRIWTDTGNVDPGTMLFSDDFLIMGADDALQEINLSAEGIVVSGPFRVGFAFMHSAPPSLTTDLDGISAADNFIFNSTTASWTSAASLGVSGDFVVRAFVEDGGVVLPDAGVPLPGDAAPGAPDSGSGECVSNGECPVGQYCNEFGACSFDCRDDGDCGDDMACNSLGMCVAADGDGGGCGCRVASARTPHPGGWVVVLLLCMAAALMRRRRG